MFIYDNTMQNIVKIIDIIEGEPFPLKSMTELPIFPNIFEGKLFPFNA